MVHIMSQIAAMQISPDYLDLAGTNIIQYRTRDQKQRQKAAEAEFTNRHLANIESIGPNTRARKQKQKVPDNEEIDMDKIAKDDTPRHATKRDLKDVLHARKVATEIERQLKENIRLQAEEARQLQMEKDIKEKEAKRRTLEKAKIAPLIDKHRSRTLKTPDVWLINWVQAIMLTQMKSRGQKKYNPNIRRQQRQAKSNHLKTRVQIPIKICRMHY